MLSAATVVTGPLRVEYMYNDKMAYAISADPDQTLPEGAV